MGRARCGYVLYPERRNAEPSRDLDAGVVVMDCLWLLPGLIPGIVALAVDFSSQSAYYPARDEEAAVTPGATVRVRVRGLVPTGSTLGLAVVDADGENLVPPARAKLGDNGRIAPALAVRVPEREALRDGATVLLTVDGDEAATVPVRAR